MIKNKKILLFIILNFIISYNFGMEFKNNIGNNIKLLHFDNTNIISLNLNLTDAQMKEKSKIIKKNLIQKIIKMNTNDQQESLAINKNGNLEIIKIPDAHVTPGEK